MEINISSIIAREVSKLNPMFEKGAKLSNKEFTPFTVDDYDYLKSSFEYFGEYTLPYFLTYSIFKDIEFRLGNPFTSEIWCWKDDIDKTKNDKFLFHQFKMLHETLHSYLALLKDEKYFQALILFRSYIEYSSQFYACLLDYEFFQKYTQDGLIDEDYKKLWFNNLRPEKVVSKIRSNHSEIDKLIKEKKLFPSAHTLYWELFKPFDSKLRGYLYSILSGLAHGSYSSSRKDEAWLYSTVFLCTAYLVESQFIIDEFSSVYGKIEPSQLFKKFVTGEIYITSRKYKGSVVFN